MRLVAFAALALLVGCSNVPATITAQNGRTWDHRCPPPGTRMITDEGVVVTYGAAVESGVCRLADGQAFVWGFLPTGYGSPDRTAVASFAHLFPAAAGRSARWTASDGAGNARVLGFERMAIGTSAVDAVVIEMTSYAPNGRQTRQRRWLETRTGALVRSEGITTAGRREDHAWQATSMTIPPNSIMLREFQAATRPLPQKP